MHIKRELNQCSGCTATIVNDRLIAVVAPNSINQITTKSTPHLKTITTVSTTSHSMVYGYGVGQSMQKRHIPSTLSSISFPVMQTNQHMNLYDVELTTESITTERSNVDDTIYKLNLHKRSSGRWVQPTRPSSPYSPDSYPPKLRG